MAGRRSPKASQTRRACRSTVKTPGSSVLGAVHDVTCRTRRSNLPTITRILLDRLKAAKAWSTSGELRVGVAYRSSGSVHASGADGSAVRDRWNAFGDASNGGWCRWVSWRTSGDRQPVTQAVSGRKGNVLVVVSPQLMVVGPRPG